MGKVLIVEDDNLIVKVYSTRLKKDGHQVITADDGEAGLALAKKEKPHVILLDIMMPKMSGLDILAYLRKDPNTAKIPVVIYSNLSRQEEKDKAKRLGVNAFITKANSTPQQVVAKLESYLK